MLLTSLQLRCTPKHTWCFLFREMLRNKILKVCFYYCSTERNSELFSLQRNGSERNSESFLFRGTAEIPSELTICFVYSVVRGIVFCRKFPSLHATGIQFLRNKEWKIVCSLLPQTSKNYKLCIYHQSWKIILLKLLYTNLQMAAPNK